MLVVEVVCRHHVFLISLPYSLQVSLKDDLLRENVGAFVNSLLLAKPAGLKKSKKHLCFTLNICNMMLTVYFHFRMFPFS